METVSKSQSEPSKTHRSLSDREKEYFKRFDLSLPIDLAPRRSRKSAASCAVLSANEMKFLGACILLSGSVRLQTEGFKVRDEIYCADGDFKTGPIVKLPTRLEMEAAVHIADEIFRRAQLNPGDSRTR